MRFRPAEERSSTAPWCGEVLLMTGDIGGIFRHLRLTVMPRDAAPG
jgi:hypothetical protein